ncbi:MAG: GH25 family lysozyme [Anaerolineae bacterium]
MPDTPTTPFDPPLPSDWAKGLDVAVWQQGLDWAAIAQAGFSFAFVKATEGDDYTDPAFAAHWQAAGDNGLLRGAYHFFWPEDDHEQQARLFVATVKQLNADDLPPIIDVEARPKAPPFPNEQWIDGVRTWLDIVEAGLGRRPMIYTSQGEWAHLRDATGRAPTWTARYPLWVANWNTAQPALPDGWDNWFFWQYKADSVPGFSRVVDYDVFRGSRDDLRRWLTGTASGTALPPTQLVSSLARPSFPLRVSYINQIEADGSGHDNCGPCCLTMALSSIGQIAAAAETPLRDIMHQVATELKGADWSTPVFTDFDGMGRYLDGRRIAHRAVRTWQGVEQTLDAGQPVILRLWNGALEPYAYGAGPGWVSKHFIVLLGYSDTHYDAADPLTFPRRDLVRYSRDSVRRAVAQLRSDEGLSFEVDAFVVGDMAAAAPAAAPMLIDPVDSAINDTQLQAYLEQYLKKGGQSVDMGSAIIKAAALAYRRGETRGPALSPEYSVKLDSGEIVARQDFSAGVAQRDPQTGQVVWLEVVLHPEELKRDHLDQTLGGREAAPEVPISTRLAGFVRRENGALRLDAQPFKFVGVNTRELLHYGNHAVTQFCEEEQIGQQLDAARQMGASVARVFLAHRAYDPDSLAAEVGDRLARALDIACGPIDNLRSDPIRLLVAFTDYNKGRGYYPRQDEPFFNPAGFLEGGAWYGGEWRTNYWPLVEATVRRFRNDPRIFAWEVGNELKLPADPATFLNFMTLVTAAIKTLDPNHLVGAGIISTLHCAFDDVQGGAFYANTNLDFATLHLAGPGADFPHLPPLPEFGDNPDEGRRRAYLAHQLSLAGAAGKPLIVEEAGYMPPEMTRLEDLATYAFGVGAAGFLPWGFSGFPDRRDRDVGDNMFGLGNFGPQFDASLFDRVIQGLAAVATAQLAPGGDRGVLAPPKKPARRKTTRKSTRKPPADH